MARSVPGLGSGSTRPLLYTHKWHWQPDPKVLDSPLRGRQSSRLFERRGFMRDTLRGQSLPNDLQLTALRGWVNLHQEPLATF